MIAMEITETDIRTALGTLRNLPTPVSGWEVETGPDWTDDPAVWVWVYLRDEEVDFETRARLREMVRDRIGRETSDWVYVRFRGASEVEAQS